MYHYSAKLIRVAGIASSIVQVVPCCQHISARDHFIVFQRTPKIRSVRSPPRICTIGNCGRNGRRRVNEVTVKVVPPSCTARCPLCTWKSKLTPFSVLPICHDSERPTWSTLNDATGNLSVGLVCVRILCDNDRPADDIVEGVL